MRFYADLHIHSKYSRATSRQCDLEHLAQWARKKGIAVVGSGDFTHPAWRAELKEKLRPAEPGLFRLLPELEREVTRRVPAACEGDCRFMLTVEISTIYKKGERTRKVHHLLLVPDFEAADELSARLAEIGNVTSDGRPILGLDSRHLLEITLESGPDSYLIPAHIWTPWFSALGSKSGFDAIDDCYGDLAPHIFAVETGLSSDPEMNWRVSSLDRFRLISSSDAHSPARLGREACIFDGRMDFHGIREALERGSGYVGTVELFPEEGKYHLDGHRKCGVCLEPGESRRLDNLCPVCGKPLVLGVMHRVEELADRGLDERPATAGEVISLVPLAELLSEVEGCGPQSKAVTNAYQSLVARLGPELRVLREVPLEDLRRGASSLVAEAVGRVRDGRVRRQAGYDGEYGIIRVFEEGELDAASAQVSLFGDVPRPVPPPPSEPDPPPKEPEREPAVVAVDASPPGQAALPLFGPEPVSPLLAGLDPDQRAAAERTRGPLLILAGPGSGKTRTLTHRIAYLVESGMTAPEHCVAVTFTRRAADELRERLGELLPGRGARVPVFTFHSLGLEILRAERVAAGLPEGFRLADEAERTELLADALAVTPRKANRWLGAVSRAKRTRIPLPDDDPAAEAQRRYAELLEREGWLDFDDLVGLAADLLERDEDVRRRVRERFRWISIDEYQDVDEQQYRLVRQLAPPDGELCVIGDPDQAIYGFRGADVRFFGRFEDDFPRAGVVRLGRNYRSSGRIVEASGQLVAAGQARSFVPEVMANLGDRITLRETATERSEAEQVIVTIEEIIGGHSFFSLDSGRGAQGAEADLSFSDFAVLYRTDAQADPLSEAFARSGIPFQRRGHGPLCELPGVAPIIAHLRELAGSEQSLDQAFVRATELATRDADDSVPPCDAAAVAAAAELLAPLTAGCGDDLARFLSTLALGAEVDTHDPRADRVSLLTLHASKGLEFEVVFIVGCEDALLPFSLFEPPDAARIAEERRLLYVGMTRARRCLYLSHARRRTWRGTARESTPSRFLADVEEALLRKLRAEPRRTAPRNTDQEQLTLL